MISFFFPVRSGSKRVKNKNIRRVLNYKLGLLEIKIDQWKMLGVIGRNIPMAQKE